jgi:methylated-DNA-[protein]-cysteine S-methyltransferase
VQIARVVLPNEQPAAPGRAAASSAPACVLALAADVARLLAGDDVAFDLGLLALEDCSPFQRRVLLAESRVKRGWVTTYGRLATHLEAPRAARAVGGALARNPFPLIIPCHRAIRADGQLGGFRGGLAMKRALLAFEGQAVGLDGRVRTERWAY